MERKREKLKIIEIAVILGHIDNKSCNLELCSNKSLDNLMDYSTKLAEIIDIKKYQEFILRDSKYHYKWSELIREVDELNLNIENLNWKLSFLLENLISSIKDEEKEIILEYKNWARQEIEFYYQNLLELYDDSFELRAIEKYRY